MKLTAEQKISAAQKFGANKSLGQNFLVDDEKLANICSALDLHKDDFVLEIGPGLGFLTELLDASGAQVLAVELDMRCVRYLEIHKFSHSKIVHADILRFKIDPQLKPLKVAGNIPYQITAPILVYMLGEIGAPSPWFDQLEYLVLMTQREVAARLMAQPGSKEYGQITLLLNYFAHVDKIVDVPAACFYPPPKVDSTVIKITPRKTPAINCSNTKILRSIITASFKSRRKMLKNNLVALFGEDNCMRAFQHVNLDPQSRAENLSLHQYSQLADELS